MAEFIPDLKTQIKKGKIAAAKSLLDSLAQQSETVQIAALEQLALAGDKTALELTGHLMAQNQLTQSFQERLFQLATDRAHLNFAFTDLLLSYGSREQISQITPLLKHIISKETQGSLLNRILRSVGKLKMTALVEDVAEFIFYDDPALKQEAIKALERMQSPKALELLEQVARTDKCDADVLDAIDVLKESISPDTEPAASDKPKEAVVTRQAPEPQEPNKVKVTVNQKDQAKTVAQHHRSDQAVADLSSPDLETRHQAFSLLSQDGKQVAQALHAHLETPDQALLTNLLTLTARTLPQESLGDLLELSSRKKLDKFVKFTVFNALAAFPVLESAAAVLDAATDPSFYLRLAAVQVLDRHCSDYIAAEIKNKIESGTKTGEALGTTILEAGAANLIDALMTSDSFSYICSNYLERNPSLQVLDTYIQVLEKRNRLSSVKKYTRLRNEKAADRPPFFAVIYPMKAVLNVYARQINSCGFEPRTFTSPQQAFESIVFEQPAAVICGLFLQDITALELAKEIREIYPPAQVPLIVSTLQKGLDESNLKYKCDQAGITTLCSFPATTRQIQSWTKG